MNEILAQIKSQFVIPVVRHSDPSIVRDLVLALSEGEMSVIEITLMDAKLYPAIEDLASRPGLTIGVGTVTTETIAKKAIHSGAKFLVAPGLDEPTLNLANDNQIAMIPGALTPSEVMRATQLRAPMIKLFPAAPLGGVNYLAQLRAPFPDVSWMVTGGVRESEIPAYRAAGAHAIGLGQGLMPQAAIESRQWASISELARGAVRAAKQSAKS